MEVVLICSSDEALFLSVRVAALVVEAREPLCVELRIGVDESALPAGNDSAMEPIGRAASRENFGIQIRFGDVARIELTLVGVSATEDAGSAMHGGDCSGLIHYRSYGFSAACVDIEDSFRSLLIVEWLESLEDRIRRRAVPSILVDEQVRMLLPDETVQNFFEAWKGENGEQKGIPKGIDAIRLEREKSVAT